MPKPSCAMLSSAALDDARSLDISLSVCSNWTIVTGLHVCVLFLGQDFFDDDFLQRWLHLRKAISLGDFTRSFVVVAGGSIA